MYAFSRRQRSTVCAAAARSGQSASIASAAPISAAA
jgi:hypothetical protein